MGSHPEGNEPVTNRRAAPDKDTIRAKLVEMIRLAADHSIDIEALIYEALDIADLESPERAPRRGNDAATPPTARGATVALPWSTCPTGALRS